MTVDWPVPPPGGTAGFLQRCLDLLRSDLGEGLVGVYVVGSIAAGEAVASTSDVDLLVVVDDDVRADWQSLGERLADLAAGCPLRGLEAVVYRHAVLRRPSHPLDYVLNVNAGPRMDRHIAAAGDPAFWFLLDVAAARHNAVALTGPDPAAVIGPAPPTAVCAALVASLSWHAQAGAATASAVLNACRSWHWAATGRWAGKTAAGRWALSQGAPPVVADALEARLAGRNTLDSGAAAEDFLRVVGARVHDHCDGRTPPA